MRLPTHISQETLKKTHDKMSGNWHGSIHQQEGFEYERRSKHRNTLGSFLVDNHGFINAAKFDELAPERDIIPIPSISSTKDMEQAISRFSHSQSFREDEDRLDSEGILRTLTALRNGRGVDSGREAYKNEEEREPPPPVFNEDAYDDATNNAFETLDPRGIRYPIKSLADESLASPSNCDRTGRLPHHYPVYNREKSVTKPQDTMAYSIATRISTTVQTIKKQSVFQNIPSLLQKSCVPLNSALNNDGEKGKPSIWSYLDPNDDLVYYDDHNDSYSSSDRGVRKNRRRKSTKKDSSLKRGATDTQQPASNALQEAYEDLMFINREAEGQQKSNQTSCSRNLSEQQQGRATRKGNYSHSNFSEIPTKISSGYRTNTPTTISTYSQSTVSRTTPDLSTEGSVSNDNLWKRNPMGETLLSSTAQIKESSPDPQKRSNELQRFEKQHFRVRAHAPIRVTVTSNDNTKSEARTENSTETTRDHERTVSNSHTHFGGQETYNTGGITYTQNPFPFGDEDVYRGWKEVAQTAVTPKSRNSNRDIVHGSFHAELVARAQTRYRSNDSGKTHQRTQQNPKKDGFETTAAFSSRNKEEESRRISTTPKRGASLDRRQMMVSNHRRGSSDKPTKPVFLPFTPDFYMLEALGREITGVPLGVSKQQQASFTITSPNKEESCVSNLSSVDGSGNGAQEEKRLENKLNKVFGRSMKNVQQLQHFKEETCQTGIPEHLPGASDPFTSEDLHSANAVEFANCLHTMERNMERGVCKLGFNTEKPKLIAGHDGTSATSESSNSTPHVASHKALGKSYREDVNGHYMYVAYSRFGEDAREVIQLCEHQSPPTPNTRNGEVLVKILSSTISATDCEIRRGEWADVRLSPYIIPGTTFVGEIHNTKRKLAFSNFKPGDRVMALVKSGCNARYICIPRDKMVKVPQGVDPELAVCMAETYLTAFQVLHFGQRASTRYRDNALKGRSFLLLGGYSSLGHALIQVSLACGADFCYVLAKGKQFEAISRLGAIPLSKDPDGWLTLIGKRIDAIITVKDNNLCTEQVTKEHLKTLTNEGQVIVIGQPGVENAFQVASTSTTKLMCKSHRNKLSERSECYNVFDSQASNPRQYKKDLEHLLSLLEDDKVEPEILERIPLSKIPKAQNIVESKRLSGHIICKPWSKESFKN